MVMIPTKIAAPSTFQLLDTNINAADSFVNTRDLQQLRINHNALISKRVMRPVLHHMCNKAAADTPLEFTWSGSIKASNDPPILFRGQVPISPFCRELRVYVVAANNNVAGTGAGDPVISAKLTNNSAGAEGPRWHQEDTAAIAAISKTAYTFDLTVPSVAASYDQEEGRTFHDLAIYGVMESQTSVKAGGPVAITNVGENWIETGTTISSQGSTVEFDTDTALSARQIQNIIPLTGGGTRLVFGAQFDRFPVPGTDTFDLRDVLGIKLWSISVYELITTSFDGSTKMVF